MTGGASGENARLRSEHYLRHRRRPVFCAAGRLIADILAGATSPARRAFISCTRSPPLLEPLYSVDRPVDAAALEHDPGKSLSPELIR